MTSIDSILESVGIDAQDLATQVYEHRRMSGEMQLVLASHFPVEDLACAVEQLAGRLAAIAEEVSYSLQDFHQGGIAKDVIHMVNDSDRKDALDARMPSTSCGSIWASLAGTSRNQRWEMLANTAAYYAVAEDNTASATHSAVA